jgi:hypothetical protein
VILAPRLYVNQAPKTCNNFLEVRHFLSLPLATRGLTLALANPLLVSMPQLSRRGYYDGVPCVPHTLLCCAPRAAPDTRTPFQFPQSYR